MHYNEFFVRANPNIVYKIRSQISKTNSVFDAYFNTILSFLTDYELTFDIFKFVLKEDNVLRWKWKGTRQSIIKPFSFFIVNTYVHPICFFDDLYGY